MEVVLELKERGLVKHVAVSSHKRKMLHRVSETWPVEVIMVRYNSAHPGAEKDIFPHLSEERPGVVAFNALKHGKMLKRPKSWSATRPVPTARQAYRFTLSNPNVDVCLSGASNGAELDDLLKVIDDGPLTDEEMTFMHEFGVVQHG